MYYQALIRHLVLQTRDVMSCVTPALKKAVTKGAAYFFLETAPQDLQNRVVCSADLRELMQVKRVLCKLFVRLMLLIALTTIRKAKLKSKLLIA